MQRIHTGPSRRASALFVAMMMVGMIGFLLLRAATTVKGQMDRQDLRQHKEQAVYAAEAAAALKEVELVSIAATNDLDKLANFGTETRAFDLNQDGDTDDIVNDIAENAVPVWQGEDVFFAGCRVRWRIEPVAVSNNDAYTVNPAPDPSIVPPTNADLGDGARSHRTNFDFYNFRISTEAYALTDRNDDTATPWSDSSDRAAVAQASRVVQLRLNTLFKYALFYAAEGPEGDIEFHNGPAMNIAGSIHSNGSIYFGGDKSKYYPGDNGAVVVGSAGDPQSVVGVDGIYRTQKIAQYQAFKDGKLADIAPQHIPVPGSKVSSHDASIVSDEMSGNYNVNGGKKNSPYSSQSSTTYRINGVAMNPGVNDSRNFTEMGVDFGPRVRDSFRGATVVKTLANIPELGGRPFEAQIKASANRSSPQPLWVRNPKRGDFTLTVIPNNAETLYYYDPYGEHGTPEDDYNLVPLDGLPSNLGSYTAEDFRVCGKHRSDDSEPWGGVSRQLYYASDPSLVSDGDKTTLYNNTYKEGSEPGNIPGLPTYIQTEPTTETLPGYDVPGVLAGGMPLYRQRTLAGDRLFAPGRSEDLLDVTDPVANPFDQDAGRDWYVSNLADHYEKAIYAPAMTDDTTNPLIDRDADGDEHDGFRVNEAAGIYFDLALNGGSSNDPGFALAIRERPEQLAAIWSEGIPDSTNFLTGTEWGGAGPDTGGGSQDSFEGGDPIYLEAEAFMTNDAGAAGHKWELQNPSPFDAGDASAGKVMQALPNSGKNYGYASDTDDSPMMTYAVDFPSTGTWYVWVRGTSTSGSDDSCHVGLDGVAESDGERVSLTNNEDLQWSKDTMGSNRAMIHVGTAGVHQFTVWMREDGAVLDKFCLTQDPDFTPSGKDDAPAAFVPAGNPQGPWGGTPFVFPDDGAHHHLYAWQYDTGGLDTAFTDADGVQSGTDVTSRGTTDEWDLDASSGIPTIMYGQAGDSYEYTVEIVSTGEYELHLEYATDQTGKTAHIEVGGQDITGPIANHSSTPLWGHMTDLVLVAGVHTLKVVFDDPGMSLRRIYLRKTADADTYTEAYAKYLKSQYQVYFGTYESSGSLIHRDVTDAFFDFEVDTAVDIDDLVAREDWVRNRRETGFMGNNKMFDIADSSLHNVPLNNFKCNWLTLNMERVCAFIREYPISEIDPTVDSTDTRKLSDEFNGMIYVSRTRRSDTLAPTGGDVDNFTNHFRRNDLGQRLMPHGYHPIWNPDWCKPVDPNYFDLKWKHNDWIKPAHGYDPANDDAMARVRCGNGPDATFQNAVRLRNGEGLYWGGIYTTPGLSRARGLTVICENPVFVQGDYNVTLYDGNDPNSTLPYSSLNSNGNSYITDDEFKNRPDGYDLPPAAVFCDSLAVLSNNWSDASESDFSGTLQSAADTWYNLSVVTNNVPTYLYGEASSLSSTTVVPSGGPHNLIRYLENWSGKWYHIKGSVVVMGPTKYTIAEAGWKGSNRTSNQKYYGAPKRDIQFNTDLFTRPGQPPFTPFGVTVIRTVQTVNLKDL